MTPTPTPEVTEEMVTAAVRVSGDGRNITRKAIAAALAASPQPVVAPSDLSGEDGLSKTIPSAQAAE